MEGSAREFFEGLEGRVDAARTAGIRSTYVFEIAGAGTWTVKVDDGALAVSEGDHGGDCTISTSEQVFERLIRGEQSPTTAYMLGRLKVRGDLGAAMKLQSLF